MTKPSPTLRKRHINIREFLKLYGTLLGFLVLFGVFSIVAPNFLTTRNLLNILRQIALLSIMSAGLTIVMITGRIDLSVGYVGSALGILAGALIVNMGLPIWLAVIITLIAGGLVGAMNGFAIAYVGIHDFVATLAIGFLVSGLNQSYTHGHPISGFPRAFGFFGEWRTWGIPNAVFIMFGFLIIIYTLLAHTRFGRYIYAIGGNEEATRLSGVNTRFHLLMSYVVCGMGIALTGIVLTSRLGSAHPLAADGMMMDALAAVFLGGTAYKEGEPNLLGTFLGALIIGVLNNGLTLLGVSYYYQDITKGVVLILAVAITSLQRMRKS